MKNIKEVVIRTDPQEWGRHWDGGSSGFTATYTRERPEDPFEVRYGTTSDFDYCHIYGGFQSCENCREWDPERGVCCAQAVRISPQELEREIDRIEREDTATYIDLVETF